MGPKRETNCTTVGPNYFILFYLDSQLGIDKLDVAKDLAVTSVKDQADRIKT